VIYALLNRSPDRRRILRVSDDLARRLIEVAPGKSRDECGATALASAPDLPSRFRRRPGVGTLLSAKDIGPLDAVRSLKVLKCARFGGLSAAAGTPGAERAKADSVGYVCRVWPAAGTCS
jgi:hypothetical protein